jgi:hypothetical protein
MNRCLRFILIDFAKISDHTTPYDVPTAKTVSRRAACMQPALQISASPMCFHIRERDYTFALIHMRHSECNLDVILILIAIDEHTIQSARPARGLTLVLSRRLPSR